MALETATYIDALVSTNPTISDSAAEAVDNHVRLLKASLLRTFPKIAGAVSASSAELNILQGALAGGVSAGNIVYLSDVTSNIQAQIDDQVPTVHNHAKTIRVLTGTHFLKGDSWNTVRNDTGGTIWARIPLEASVTWSALVEIDLIQLNTASFGVVVDAGVVVHSVLGDISLNDAVYLAGIGAQARLKKTGTDIWLFTGDLA